MKPTETPCDPRDSACYFALHYDLHAGPNDTRLGLRCSPDELVPMLNRMGPEFVQTDCKGHRGYTSWFSQTPTASVPAKLRKDALQQWRQATRKLGLPLHCHYSGIWDDAAWERFPAWRAVPPGKELPESYHGRMCLRSGYLHELLIPQMIELIDRYEVDGFWVDGDIWAVVPCYCDACRAEYRKRFGRNPPRKTDHPDWPQWWGFTLDSFVGYVRTYARAVHEHAPGVRVCSNWLHTYRCPVADPTGVDFISGDNSHLGGLDASRCEARYIATHGLPWDIMIWGFYFSQGRHGDPKHPGVCKPVQMLQQEAAVILSLGGGVQVYEHPEVRDGRLVDWRQERFGQVGRFVKARRSFCGPSESVPQVAVLHSDVHLRKTTRGDNLMYSPDKTSVGGATWALLENHYGVDLFDEPHLLDRLDDYPILVAPERNAMSDEMVQALRRYVHEGGRLFLSGADAWERFGGSFLGVRKGRLESGARFFLNSDDGMVPVWSETWRLSTPTKAEGIGTLGRTSLPDDELLPNASAFLRRLGKGTVLYAPFDLFADYHRSRYPMTRDWVGTMMHHLAGRRPIEIRAPRCVDVSLRRQPGRTIVHLVNRATGLPKSLGDGAVDEIPLVGPVFITLRTTRKPDRVREVFEKARLKWQSTSRTVTAEIGRVHIHAAVVFEGIELQHG